MLNDGERDVSVWEDGGDCKFDPWQSEATKSLCKTGLSPYQNRIHLAPTMRLKGKTAMKTKPRKKSYSIGEQISYNMERSKKGTKDRNGKKLSDFMRGKYAGKAEGQISMVKLHNKQSTKTSGATPLKRKVDPHKTFATADNVYLTKKYAVKRVVENRTNYNVKNGTPNPNYKITNTYIKRTPEIDKASRNYSPNGQPIKIKGAKVSKKFK